MSFVIVILGLALVAVIVFVLNFQKREHIQESTPSIPVKPIDPMVQSQPPIDVIPSEFESPSFNHALAYGRYRGPMVGEPMGVSVPVNSLKTLPPWTMDSGSYQPLVPYFGSIPPKYAGLLPYIATSTPTPLDIPVHNSFGRDVFSRPGTRYIGAGIPADSRIYGGPRLTVPVTVASVYPEAPLPSLTRGLYQIGVLSSMSGDGLLNLYAKPIAPNQDLWQYAVQDKNGMTVYLDNVKELEDGDKIHSVTGKASKDPWKVTLYDRNRWVLV